MAEEQKPEEQKSKDNFTEIYIHRLADEKKAEAWELLDQAVGLFLKVKESWIAVLKAPGIIQIEREADKGVTLWVLGVTSSQTDVRNFHAEFATLETRFKNRFSLRDLNFYVVKDFICEWIQYGLYESKSEKALPYEFIVAQTQPGTAYFAIIDHEGNFRPLDIEHGDIIGCPDPEKREKIKSSLAKEKLEEMPPENMNRLLLSVTEPFKGEVIVASFEQVSQDEK